MTKQLTNLELDEISLVDDPANQHAKVVIVKAKGGKGDFKPCDNCTNPKSCVDKGCKSDNDGDETKKSKEIEMNVEELQKALEDAEGKIVDLTKRVEDAEAKAKAADEAVAKAKEAAATEEDVLKSLPEPVRKRLEEAEAKAKAADEAVQKMKDEAEDREAIAKAKELGFGEPDKIGPALLRIRKGKATEEDAVMFEGIIKAAASVAKNSELFKSVGKSEGESEADPEAIIKSKTEALMKAEPKLTYEAAYAAVLKAEPKLYSDYVAKRRVR